jgi:tryptophan synthase alpha chain
MSRISERFSLLSQMKQAGLIGFVTAGDPSSSHTILIVDALIRGGVDILELGIPFSDPIADGPTIQASTYRALKSGTTPSSVFESVERIREKHNIPIVLFTYYNPIFRIGIENFFNKCEESDVDGVAVPDLPYDEGNQYRHIAHKHKVDTIFFATPTTSIDRLKEIIRSTSGFLYLVSLLGVTGARDVIQQRTLGLVKRVHHLTVGTVPLAVGFGISKPEHVRLTVDSGADGVIVGSAFINIVERNRNDDESMLREVEACARILKQATGKERPVDVTG